MARSGSRQHPRPGRTGAGCSTETARPRTLRRGGDRRGSAAGAGGAARSAGRCKTNAAARCGRQPPSARPRGWLRHLHPRKKEDLTGRCILRTCRHAAFGTPEFAGVPRTGIRHQRRPSTVVLGAERDPPPSPFHPHGSCASPGCTRLHVARPPQPRRRHTVIRHGRPPPGCGIETACDAPGSMPSWWPPTQPTTDGSQRSCHATSAALSWG